MHNQVKPRTSTKNPVIRYLYAIIFSLLKNVWIVLLWMHFSPVKSGPRTIDMGAFRFDCFIVIIWEAIWASLGMVKEFPSYCTRFREKRGETEPKRRIEEENLVKY